MPFTHANLLFVLHTSAHTHQQARINVFANIYLYAVNTITVVGPCVWYACGMRVEKLLVIHARFVRLNGFGAGCLSGFVGGSLRY